MDDTEETVYDEGKPFALRSLAQHERDCPRRNPTRDGALSGPALKPADLIGGDLPNGAYWALTEEFRCL